MLTEANDFEARVAPIAAEEGILPPVGQRFVQRADLQLRIAASIGSNPIDLDKEFLADEIYSHKLALESAKLMSHEVGGNPKLITISDDLVRILEQNLTRLETLQADLRADKY